MARDLFMESRTSPHTGGPSIPHLLGQTSSEKAKAILIELLQHVSSPFYEYNPHSIEIKIVQVQ